MLCADGPVRSIAELSLAGEHRRGHGSGYAALARGRVDTARSCRSRLAPRAGPAATAANLSSVTRPPGGNPTSSLTPRPGFMVLR
ncbi:hypothetical protein [Amycolatopsis sp. cmx-4-68]|uniref:hypothetical protein n=1 Tax=Amycolatopsis sp. cmx-4-68 TaxID=2790938 RepID=UPI00397B2177